MKLHELIENYILYITSVRAFSKNTINSYSRDLAKLEKILEPDIDIDNITSEDLLLSIGVLSKEKKSTATINRFIVTYRSLFSYATRVKLINNNPALAIRTVKQSTRLPKFMTNAEVTELCNQPLKHSLLWKNRDRAILTMLYSTGCRISEIISLKLSDFMNDYRKAIVTGKGKKQRIVYLEDNSHIALLSYLEDRKNILKCQEKQTDYLFISQAGNPLTVSGLRFIINKYSGTEGTNRHVNPHAFRHTFATQLINNGADIRLVQEMLGHSCISTTQQYTHISTDKLIEVYNKTHPHK